MARVSASAHKTNFVYSAHSLLVRVRLCRSKQMVLVPTPLHLFPFTERGRRQWTFAAAAEVAVAATSATATHRRVNTKSCTCQHNRRRRRQQRAPSKSKSYLATAKRNKNQYCNRMLALETKSMRFESVAALAWGIFGFASVSSNRFLRWALLRPGKLRPHNSQFYVYNQFPVYWRRHQFTACFWPK